MNDIDIKPTGINSELAIALTEALEKRGARNFFIECEESVLETTRKIELPKVQKVGGT